MNPRLKRTTRSLLAIGLLALLAGACGKSSSKGAGKASAKTDHRAFCTRYCAKVTQCKKEGAIHTKLPKDCVKSCVRQMKDSRGRSELEPARGCLDKPCKQWTDCLIDEATKAAGAG